MVQDRGGHSFLLVLALTACHVQQRTDTGSDQISGRKYRVALVAKSAESAFWKSVRAGANAASTEYNLDFVFQAPLSEEDYEAQNNMIESAVEETRMRSYSQQWTLRQTRRLWTVRRKTA